MKKVHTFNNRLLQSICIIYPALWLYLPNLAIFYFNPQYGISLKSMGLLIALLCTLPFFILISKTLRQFWAWNLPFALISGFYTGYIVIYHGIPYDGIWFAIWNASFDVDLGMLKFFLHKLLIGVAGFVLYLLCMLHPIQKKIIFAKTLKQYLIFISVVIILINICITNYFSQKIPIQRMIDLSVMSDSYPVGMVAMLIKTGISVSHKTDISMPPLNRKKIPNGREIYVLVIGEAARNADWQMVSDKFHSFLYRDPDVKIFNDVVSQANLTSFSLPLIVTGTSTLQEAVNNPTYMTFAKAAGCTTGWLSNSTEPFNYAYQNDFYDLKFDHYSLKGVTYDIYDDVLFPEIQRAVTQGPEKLCLVVHLIGSHFDYLERYRADFAKFPVNMDAYNDTSNPQHVLAFHNAYLNSLMETNYLLEEIITLLKSTDATSFLLYTADHAESFDDDNSNQFFHGNPHPKSVELRVPFFIWANKSYQNTYPEKWSAIIANQQRKVSNRQILPTMVDALSIDLSREYFSSSLLQNYKVDDSRMIFLPSTDLVPFKSL